jgi:hypothetical protein
MLLSSDTVLWSIIGDAGLFVSSVVPSAQVPLSFDILTGKMGTRPLRKLAEAKGVHYAREASGHQSDRYIWRYVKPDQQALAEAVDELE